MTGRVYIIFSIEDIMTSMGCANQKAAKLLYELESKCSLIERKRQGLGKPNLIYVKNFVTPSESHFKKCENHDSGLIGSGDAKHLATQMIVWEFVCGYRDAASYALLDNCIYNAFCKNGANAEVAASYNAIAQAIQNWDH